MFAWTLLSLGWMAHSEVVNAADDPASQTKAIFERACTSCHDSTDELDLSGDLRSLIGRPGDSGVPLIVPGKPDESYLVHKLGTKHPIKGDVMPVGDDPLPPAEIAVISQWIAELPPAAAEGSQAAGSDGKDSPQTPSKARPAFNGTHQINLPSTSPLGRNVLEMRVHHRFGRIGKPGEGNYFGLANGAVMSLGVAYGIVDSLDVLLRFSNASKDWELGAKYVPLQQEKGRPLSLAVYASAEWLSVSPRIVDNRWTGSAQLLLSRLWFERWATQMVVTGAFLTDHQKLPQIDDGSGAGPRSARDKRMTVGVGLASTVYFDKKRRYGLDLEYNLPLPIGGRPDRLYFHGGDADPNGTKIGSWALGLSARVGLHFFQVFWTNTQAIHTNLFAPGGDTENPFDPFGSFFFGFNLSRKWTL